MTTSPGESTNLLNLISSKLAYLPGAMRQVAEFVLEHPEQCQTMSITTLAGRVGVAESTVSRFVRELDLSGYQALRLGLAEASFRQRAEGEHAHDGLGRVYDGIGRHDSIPEVIAKVARSSIESVRMSAARLNADAVAAAVDAISGADVLVFCCMGSSALAGEAGVMRFTRAGKKCILFRDQSVQAMMTTALTQRDTVIGISDSGESTVVREVLKQARLRGARTIGITSTETSPLVEHSDVALFTAHTQAGGALYGETVTSKWGQTLVIDVLYAAYAARHFDATLQHLEATYQVGIAHSRTQ